MLKTQIYLEITEKMIIFEVGIPETGAEYSTRCATKNRAAQLNNTIRK